DIKDDVARATADTGSLNQAASQVLTEAGVNLTSIAVPTVLPIAVATATHTVNQASAGKTRTAPPVAQGAPSTAGAPSRADKTGTAAAGHVSEPTKPTEAEKSPTKPPVAYRSPTRRPGG